MRDVTDADVLAILRIVLGHIEILDPAGRPIQFESDVVYADETVSQIKNQLNALLAGDGDAVPEEAGRD